MGVENNDLTKLCSFYVSDWHLVTMLLPYINKKINEESKIAIVLEKDLQENIVKLVEKLNIKNKEKILNLNWKKANDKERIFNNNDYNDKIIIINGTKEFIEKKNTKIHKYLKTHKINGKIKVINCYEITEYGGSITEILNNHDMVLNTSGERKIEEIFQGFNKELNERKIV